MATDPITFRQYHKSQYRTVDGVLEKTCTSYLHEGDRWLPYNDTHYSYSRQGLRTHCKKCSVAMTRQIRERRKAKSTKRNRT